MKIKDLPQPYRELALIEQESQGNERNENLKLIADVEDGNFCWDNSFCGDDFWIDVDEENYPEITPEIKAKFPSVFKEVLIEKWELEAKYHERYTELQGDEGDFSYYKGRVVQLRQCIKDYQKFIKLKK
jgi:hypothetical protein